MRNIILLLTLLTCSPLFSMSCDEMSDILYYRNQPCIPAPVPDRTIVKLEPMEMFSCALQSPEITTDLSPVKVKTEPREILQNSNASRKKLLSQIKEKNLISARKKKRTKDFAWTKSRQKKCQSRKPGNFICSICEEKLSYKWTLVSHMKRVHGQLSRWGCPFYEQIGCKTTFNTNSDYRRHLTNVHDTSYRTVTKRILPTNLSSKIAASTLMQRIHTRSTTRTLTSEA